MQDGRGLGQAELLEPRLRMETLLSMTADIQLPSVGALPPLNIPFHVASLLKRFFLSARSGVPLEKIVTELNCLIETGKITRETKDWTFEVCREYHHKHAVHNDVKPGSNSGKKVHTSMLKIDSILPSICSPANWSYPDFFDFLIEELQLMEKRWRRDFNCKISNPTMKTTPSDHKSYRSQKLKLYVLDLLHIQRSVCLALFAQQTWAELVSKANCLLEECLNKAVSQPDMRSITRVFMAFMRDCAAVWHGWFVAGGLLVEDFFCMRAIVTTVEGLIETIQEKDNIESSALQSLEKSILSDEYDVLSPYASPCASPRASSFDGCTHSVKEEAVFWDDALDDLVDTLHEGKYLTLSSSAKVLVDQSENVKSSYYYAQSNQLEKKMSLVMSTQARKLINFIEFCCDSPGSPVVIPEPDLDPVKSDVVCESKRGVSPHSDVSTLISKMHKIFSVDSVAVIKSSFFQLYYRNPRHSIRGFPCLPGGGDYGLLEFQEKGRGGGSRDRQSVFVEIQLEYSPGGGVWVVAEVCEELTNARNVVVQSSVLSISDLKASLDDNAVLDRASPLHDSTITMGEKKKYIAELFPRAWKCPYSLHIAGTRKPKRFILRVQVWAFSPRGVGVFVTQVKSPPFYVSSTQNLRSKSQKRKSPGLSFGSEAESKGASLKCGEKKVKLCADPVVVP